MAINPACNALTDVSRLRAAGFGGGATDDALQLAINAISVAVENFCDRVFRPVTYTENPEGEDEHPPEELQGTGLPTLLLSSYPILDVSKVWVDGSEVSDWKLVPRMAQWGGLWRPSTWPERGGRWGLLSCEPDGEAAFNIRVCYTGGFRAVPADLELAVMREVDIYAAGSGGKASRQIRSEKTPGGWAVAYRDDREGLYNEQGIAFSLSSIAILTRYKRREI